MLEGRPVVALTEATDSIKGTTGNITVYRKTQRGFEPPALRDS